MYLSKSNYCSFWQCPKMAWLNKYKPDVKAEDPNMESVYKTGHDVNELAKRLFGDYVDVTSYKHDKLDIGQMLENTQEEVKKCTSVICEAAFSYNGLYCAVDLLRKEENGWAIYEVKSSTNDDEKKDKNPIYIADISFEKYVLEHSGINVTSTYLVSINRKYVFDGTMNLDEFFYIIDVSDDVSSEQKNIDKNLKLAESILGNTNEPNYDLDTYCKKPYECAFWDYCAAHIPNPSVFDLYRLRFDKKIDLYHNNLIKFDDLYNSGKITNATQLRQLDFSLNDKGTYTEPENIKKFLSDLSYPLYFLDFETLQSAIPQFPGTTPYQQIPFQYSLHYIEEENGKLMHKEFLAESGKDPRRDIAEALVRDIPMNVCVTAYNKSFECSRLKELANTFPDLTEHLLNIRDNIIDLLDPFQKGYYYNKAMGGSFSIKSVLPAIFPNDPELDYHNLEGVHNGTEAMNIFPKIQYMSREEQSRARHNLLKYCELDTYAMVKVWQELVRAASE